MRKKRGRNAIKRAENRLLDADKPTKPQNTGQKGSIGGPVDDDEDLVAVRGQPTVQTPTFRLRFKSAPLTFVTFVTFQVIVNVTRVIFVFVRSVGLRI